MSLQIPGQAGNVAILVNFIGIKSVVALRPGMLIHPLVIVAGGCHTDTVYARILEHSRHGCVTTGRIAPHANAAQVNLRIPLF